MPQKSYNQFKSFDELINRFEDRFEHHKSSKSSKLSNKAFLNREINLASDGLIEFRSNKLVYSILNSFIPYLKDKLEEVENSNPVVSKPLVEDFPKIKWLGTPSQLGFIFKELAEKGIY